MALDHSPFIQSKKEFFSDEAFPGVAIPKPFFFKKRNLTFNDKMAEAASPEPRWGHESVLIGDNLYLIGGWDGKSEYFSRSEIWTCNVREEKKWIRRVTKGKNIPPPCRGARCVIINGIVYTYGGKKPDGECLREVFGLDSKEVKWIQVATLTGAHRKKPWQRSNCCLWAIGDRLIMFGGWSKPIPQDLRQAGARFKSLVNNEIFELKFEERREKGKVNE